MNPFIYGEEVEGRNFCNRTAEIKELLTDIQNGQNIMIYSPRRYGKTSLIKEVLRKAKKEGVLTVYVDLYPALNEKDFIQCSIKAMASEEKGSLDAVVLRIKKLFKRVSPKVSVGLGEGGQPTFNFSLDSTEIVPALEDIFNGFHNTVKTAKKKAVIVFDEFQQIAYFGTDRVEKSLRSVIQSHRGISYIFMGSKKHLIYDMFSNPERPFYKSTKHFPLNRIDNDALMEFINSKFEHVRNIAEISPEILDLTECHPYYTQFLCNVLWEFSSDKKSLRSEDVEASLKILLAREEAAYDNLWSLLTTNQKQVLVALAKSKKDDKVFSTAFLKEHNIGSTGGMQKVFKNLLEKNIVDKEDSRYTIMDIFLKRWILRMNGRR